MSRPHRRWRPLSRGGAISTAASASAARKRSRQSGLHGKGRGGEGEGQGTRQETEEETDDDVEQRSLSIDYTADCSASVSYVSISFHALPHRVVIQVSQMIFHILFQKPSQYLFSYKKMLNEVTKLPSKGRPKEEQEEGEAGRGGRGLRCQAPPPRGGEPLGAAAGAAAPATAAAAAALAGRACGRVGSGECGEGHPGLCGDGGAMPEEGRVGNGRMPGGRGDGGGGGGGLTGRDEPVGALGKKGGSRDVMVEGGLKAVVENGLGRRQRGESGDRSQAGVSSWQSIWRSRAAVGIATLGKTEPAQLVGACGPLGCTDTTGAGSGAESTRGAPRPRRKVSSGRSGAEVRGGAAVERGCGRGEQVVERERRRSRRPSVDAVENTGKPNGSREHGAKGGGADTFEISPDRSGRRGGVGASGVSRALSPLQGNMGGGGRFAGEGNDSRHWSERHERRQKEEGGTELGGDDGSRREGQRR